MAGKSSSRRLFEITSEWFLDYCIFQLWKEFKEKRSFSECWEDAVQDYLENKPFNIGQELSNKLHCIRFIIGLLEHQQADVPSSQQTCSEEQSEDERESTLLGCDCLKFFDKIAQIFPFSDVEKSHMRNTLKLQIVLSHYRHGDIKDAKNLYSKLYSEKGDDEEYQDDIRELFQSVNESWKETFFRKNTYDRFLNQVQQFFTPAWKKFETPVLEEALFLEDLNNERPRMDAKTLKVLYFAWDQSDEVEQNWSSVVEGSHPDISAVKRQVVRSRGEASSSKKPSLKVNIQRCDEVLKNLKKSSRNLFSELRDTYRSEYVSGEAGPSPDSRSEKTVDMKKGKRSLERRSLKRRYNEEQSDAEIVDWNSDSDDETDNEMEIQKKTTKLSSPVRKRVLDVKLPKVQLRKFWSSEETKWLEEGVKVYGEGNWAQILKAYNFNGRTSVNLKDRWRNLQKNK